MTKMGAVNCSTMALAAVVILLARRKTRWYRTPPAPPAAPTGSASAVAGNRQICAMTTRAMAVRPPLMAMPPQGMTLMQSPPTLYSRAARNTNSVPLRSFFKPQHTPCSGHRKRPRPGRGQRANMLRGTTSGSRPPHGARPRGRANTRRRDNGAPGARLLGKKPLGCQLQGYSPPGPLPLPPTGALFAAPRRLLFLFLAVYGWDYIRFR